MALKMVEIIDNKFLYRCDSCGFEHPYRPMKKEELGPPPPHHCKQAAKEDFEVTTD